MLRTILVYSALATALLSAGCAALPEQELQGARRAVAEAYHNKAFRLAPDEFQAASEALREGELLVRRGRYERAGEVLSFAESHARRADLLARQEQDRIEEKRRRELRDRMEQQKKTPLPSPPPLIAAPVEVEPPTPSPPTPSPPSKPQSEPQPEPQPLDQYTVTGGETLWTIAAQRNIYGDALLWPLIYRANRDQIKDPRQIYPGQILSIPRDLSVQEKKEARDTARKSDIFPLQELMSTRSSTPISHSP